MARKSLTESDKTYIRENYLLVQRKVLCDKTRCSESNIAAFMKREGLSIPKHIRDKRRIAGMIGKTTATIEEDEIIKREYLITPLKAICDKFMPHRSFTFVAKRLSQLGLVIPPEIIAERKQIGRLKAGNTPVNKGRPMSEWMSKEGMESSSKTRFKKGNKPHNTKPSDGEIVIRKKKGDNKAYKFIRVSLGHWEFLHRHNWTKANGKIPKDSIVIFKDGDSMNCNIENLELITKAENAIRNSGTINLTDGAVATYLTTKSRVVNKELRQEILNNHPDLITLKRNQLLLSREIKKYGKL